MTNTASAPSTAGQNKFEITTSRLFEGFLRDSGACLAVTTYQAGMVLLLGINRQTGKLWVFNRHIERPMGIAGDRTRLAVAALTQIITFVNGRSGTPEEAADPIFVPQLAHFTGDLDVHDIAFGADGELVFVNTLFSCLATVSPTHSFRPIWTPNFVSRLAPEDRCHLNGLAMREQKPAYVSAVSQTDIADGWRDRRRDGGVIIDVASDEVVARALSMPHSPRWHDGRLWMLNAGSGEVGVVDLGTGRFDPVAFCPGYLRGMAFLGQYAIVGASEPRENRTFGGLALQDRLDKEGVSARCGLFVIDTVTGDVVHHLTFYGIVSELFDVVVVPNASQAQMVGFRSDEIRRVVSIEEPAQFTA